MRERGNENKNTNIFVVAEYIIIILELRPKFVTSDQKSNLTKPTKYY